MIQSIMVATLVYTTGSRQHCFLPRMHLLKTPAATYLRKKCSIHLLKCFFALFPFIFLHHEGGPIITITGRFSNSGFGFKIMNLEEILPTFRITLSRIIICMYLCCCRTSCVCAQIVSKKNFCSWKHSNMPLVWILHTLKSNCQMGIASRHNFP